jgi:hypothetical protein
MREIANTYVLGIPALGGAKGHLMAVLVKDAGAGGDVFACYLGIVPRPENDEHRAALATMVADRGTKQRLKDARTYFPALADESYMH